MFSQALLAFEDLHNPSVNQPESTAESQADADTTQAEREKHKAKKKGHGRNSLPKHLPRVVHRIEVPQEQRQCATCGQSKSCIGHATSERIEFKPASLYVHVDAREKLACTNCQGEVSIAPTADHLIEKSIAAEGFLAQLVVGKFADGLPLARMAKMFRREGVHLADSTLGDLVRQTADQLTSLAAYISQRVLSAPYINQDDTGLAVLDRDHPNGIKKGHIWAFVHKQDVVFKFTPNWRGEHPREFLKDYCGIIQGDGYSGIDKLFTQQNGGPIRAGCMMHCRRYFFEAHQTGDPVAGVALALIHDIYKIEAEAKTRRLNADERLALRQEKSLPLTNRLKVFIETAKQRALPKCYLGKAITYATKQWDALMVPFSRGDLEIDNAEAERHFKAVAIARKNFLFAGSDKAAERSAVLLTVLSTAVSHGVNPFIYLKDVLMQIAGGIPKARIGELHPAAWANKRGEQVTAQQIPAPRLVN